MPLGNPEDAMPWVGLYVAGASLVCIIAMVADFFNDTVFLSCRFFTLNAATMTLIPLSTKLMADLTSIPYDSNDETVSDFGIFFLFAMLANFLPSLGDMGDKELMYNVIALGILMITLIVNVCITFDTNTVYMVLPLVLVLSVALAVPAIRRLIAHQYNELHGVASSDHQVNLSTKELVHHVKKCWVMAQTGNPQFVIASTQVSSALGVACILIMHISLVNLAFLTFHSHSSNLTYGQSAYKWSIKVIIIVQHIGAFVASIAPLGRVIVASQYLYSNKGNLNYLNIFRVSGYWTQRLRQWKRSHVHSHIPGSHWEKVFHVSKNVILSFCLALQIMVVVTCNIIHLFPRSLMPLQSCFRGLWRASLKRFKENVNVSNVNGHVSNTDAVLEMKEYANYVLQIEDNAEFSDMMLDLALRSFNRLLEKSEKKEPCNLIKLLEKSAGFKGVVEFDNDQVPPLHSEEVQNSWSLVVVTLTAIVVALPNTANDHAERLLVSIREGLQIVRSIEECLKANSDLVKSRKAARRVWTEVEVYSKWLHIDLLEKARNRKTSKEILQWLGDEAVKIVIQFKSRKRRRLDYSLHKFIVASSMYRVSQTILLHHTEQENWPNDGELFEWIANMIADILCACFTNLPHVIRWMCHHDGIEKRADNVRSAAQLLGTSRKILQILEARQVPNLDVDSMAYIDNWHALPKSEIPNGSASSNQVQPACSSPDESVIIDISV